MPSNTTDPREFLKLLRNGDIVGVRMDGSLFRDLMNTALNFVEVNDQQSIFSLHDQMQLISIAMEAGRGLTGMVKKRPK